MPNVSSVENNFTKGYVTEFTGLNFPENAAMDTDNCVYEIVGDVTRRLGIDFEPGYQNATLSNSAVAMSTYVWNNAGGDGEVKLYVKQFGGVVNFYNISAATTSSGISHQYIGTVNINTFAVTAFDQTIEATYADGNGYLFIYHDNCSPIYITYSNGVVGGTAISVKIRDFAGLTDSSGANFSNRPASLTIEHQYNLINQGWTAGSPWTSNSTTSNTVKTSGSITYTVNSGMSVTLGDGVNIVANITGVGLPTSALVMSGNVTAYAGTTMTINVTGSTQAYVGQTFSNWTLSAVNKGYIDSWHTAIGNYPSNADVWWYFKNPSNTFDPGTTINQTSYNSGNAPRGHFILDAFSLNRSLASSIAGLTSTVTNHRPTVGTWYQGRVWYTGVNSNQAAAGDAPFYTWTENIYFSQIVQTTNDFGNCFQTNDPTSETLNGLLPTDGGVITIQGTGRIHKLFPIANGLLVFANNGVWFITGSQGIGFSATDYTVTKLSSVKCLSPQSFVDVNGLPFFWNEEGIYVVSPQQGGSLTVEPITVSTILSYYETIPLNSKYYARGSYNPVDYVIQWTFKSTEETGISDRYNFDRIMNFNTYNKAFYPYTIAQGTKSQFVHGVDYISFPNISSTTPDASFYYPTTYSIGVGLHQMSQLNSSTYKDWNTLEPIDYTSYFVTGYKLHGQGQRRFQVPYIYIFSKSTVTNAYKIQGIWDYATVPDSGRWSVPQLVLNVANNFGMRFRRHRIRGRGLVLQLRVSSVTGQPFDIMGWSTFENLNQSV